MTRARTYAVSADQEVAFGFGAVFETRDDRSVQGFGRTGQALAELDPHPAEDRFVLQRPPQTRSLHRQAFGAIRQRRAERNARHALPALVPQDVLLRRDADRLGEVEGVERAQCVQAVRGDGEIRADVGRGTRVCLEDDRLEAGALQCQRGCWAGDTAADDESRGHAMLLLPKADY